MRCKCHEHLHHPNIEPGASDSCENRAPLTHEVLDLPPRFGEAKAVGA